MLQNDKYNKLEEILKNKKTKKLISNLSKLIDNKRKI